MAHKTVEQLRRTYHLIKLATTQVQLRRKPNSITGRAKVMLLLDTTTRYEKTICWMKIHLRMIHLENNQNQNQWLNHLMQLMIYQFLWASQRHLKSCWKKKWEKEMVEASQLSNSLPQDKNRMGLQYPQRRSSWGGSHNIKVFQQGGHKVKQRNNIDTTSTISKTARLRLKQMEETDHRARPEKAVASKVVDSPPQLVKDPLDTIKQEVILHLLQINLISTSGINWTKSKKAITMRPKAQTKDQMSKSASSWLVALEMQEVVEVLLQTKKHQLDQKTKKVQWLMNHIHKTISMPLTSLTSKTRTWTLLTISRIWKTVWKSRTRTSRTHTLRIKRETKNCLKMIQMRMTIKPITRILKTKITEVTWSRRCSTRMAQLNSGNSRNPQLIQEAHQAALFLQVFKRFWMRRKNN